ncbi:hypothetical protein RUM4293_01281 [Ruegeria atlantica]|uniref:Uncharacterized protein n=1 Tax=Ruegeria atlantica TaxID=81569 RepID=A0A0P1EJD9_9RHOB|nr:hypothetical protein RUM4293_01281 [Ruegeria atlantica]
MLRAVLRRWLREQDFRKTLPSLLGDKFEKLPMYLAFTNGMAISVAKVKNSQKTAEASWEICSRHRGKISTKRSFSDAKTSKLQTGCSPRRRRKSELRTNPPDVNAAKFVVEWRPNREGNLGTAAHFPETGHSNRVNTLKSNPVIRCNGVERLTCGQCGLWVFGLR